MSTSERRPSSGSPQSNVTSATPPAQPPATRSRVRRAAQPAELSKHVALRVLILRHAIAEDLEAGRRDADRSLTREGRRKMRRAARGLTTIVPTLDALATSPLVRAAQTADIVIRRYAKSGRAPKLVRLSALAPAKPYNLLLGWLAEQPDGATVALVGHEPHLSEFVSWTLTGLRESFIELKKGGAILIEFRDAIRPAHARLLWHLKPSQLRALAEEGPE